MLLIKVDDFSRAGDHNNRCSANNIPSFHPAILVTVSSVADKRYRIAFCAANSSECDATAFSYRTNSDAK